MTPRSVGDIAATSPVAEAGMAHLSSRLSGWAAKVSTWRLSFLVAIVTLAMGLPGFLSIPPVDRDEARFAQATKQMMETGDYIDIRLQDEARHKKPVGIYWLQAASAHLTGQGADAPIWVYRIPSLIGIAAAAAFSTVLASMFLGGPRALIVGLLVGAAILPGVEARLAKTDAVLLATIVAFHIAVAQAWVQRRTASPLPSAVTICAWLAMGIGILVKGPIAPLVGGLTILALSLTAGDWRWIRALRPLRGLAIALVVAAPWYIAIAVETEGAFFWASVGADMLAKVGAGQESHGAPPGVHLLAMIGTFWPLSALAVLAIPRLRARLSDPTVRFALCWAVPTWLVFELTPTKLPHYILPILPAIALIVVALLKDGVGGPRWATIAAKVLLAAVPTVVGLALIAAGLYLQSIAILIGASIVLSAAFLGWRGEDRTVLAWSFRAILVAFLLYLGTYPFGFARLSPLWVSSALARAVEDVALCEASPVMLAGFREPSAVFLLGTETHLVGGGEAAKALAEDPCVVAIVEDREWDAFRGVAPDATVSARVDGFNLNGGDSLHFRMVTAAP